MKNIPLLLAFFVSIITWTAAAQADMGCSGGCIGTCTDSAGDAYMAQGHLVMCRGFPSITGVLGVCCNCEVDCDHGALPESINGCTVMDSRKDYDSVNLGACDIRPVGRE